MIDLQAPDRDRGHRLHGDDRPLGSRLNAAVMAQREPLTADQRNSFVAALLGWMMDAFDYFLVVLV